MNNHWQPTIRRTYGRIEKWSSTLTDAVICASSTEYDHAIELGIRPDCLRLIPNGGRALPTVDRSVVRSELGLEFDDIAIGFVGRLNPQKAVDVLIASFAMLTRDRPDLRLVIVGQGQLEKTLRQQATSSGVLNQIIWTGPAGGSRVMAGLDIFALSSSYEGFPYVLMVAALRGLPIITTAVGGAREMVSEGVNDRIFDVGDVTAFSAALRSLVEDKVLRHHMGLASQQMSEEFTVEKMAERTIEPYRGIS